MRFIDSLLEFIYFWKLETYSQLNQIKLKSRAGGKEGGAFLRFFSLKTHGYASTRWLKQVSAQPIANNVERFWITKA